MRRFWNWIKRLFGFGKQETANPQVVIDKEAETIKEMDNMFKDIVWFESCGQGLRQVMKPIKNDSPSYILGLPVSFIGPYNCSKKMEKVIKDYLESYQIIEKSNEQEPAIAADITKEYCGEDCKRCNTLYHGGYDEGIVEGYSRVVCALNSFFRRNDIDCQLGIKDDNSDIDIKYKGDLHESIMEEKNKIRSHKEKDKCKQRKS